MPPPNSPTTQSTYNTLITALHPPSPPILELDILPPTYAPHIHLSPPSLALPKTLLTPLYLHARQILFAHLSRPDNGSNKEEEAWKATTVLLLWDPNHITAANVRKRWISDLAERENGAGVGVGGENWYGKGGVKAAVEQELRFLETLVTSPLKKHTKAPTLWAQRGWVVGTFWDEAVHHHDQEKEEAGSVETVTRFWDEELGIVMRAGERHPRNYYAWQYARVLFWIVEGKIGVDGDGDGDGEVEVEGRRGLLGETLGRVKGWCFLHPRDISGWGFLMFLIQVVEGGGAGKNKVMGGGDEARREVQRVVRETREWVRKFEWKGESVEWFLKGVVQLGIEK